MTYRASLTALADAREPMISLWLQNLPIDREAAAEKFGWFYFDAPAGAGTPFLLHNGPEASAPVVGCSGIGPRALHFRGRQINAALMADLAVDRSHRSGYPAILLQRTVRRHAKASFDVAYGYPNVHAVALHVKLGFHSLGKMERFARVTRHRPYVARRTSVPLVPAVGGAALDIATRIRASARSASSRVGRKLVVGDVIDERFDELWLSARESWPMTGRRDAAFLRWRHVERPGRPSIVVTMSKRSSRELHGYAIVRETEQATELADLFARNEEELDSLVGLLIPALSGLRGTALSFAFLGTPIVPEILREHGFRLREAVRTVIVDAGATCPIDLAVLTDPANWYLTDGDEDI